MKMLFFFAGFFGCCLIACGQNITPKLAAAFQTFATDGQLKHASYSLYVIDAKSGAVVYDRNSQLGLAPASTQKIITSVTAFEILGKDFRFQTSFAFNAPDSSLRIIGSGDPTLGSPRWTATKASEVLRNVMRALGKADQPVAAILLDTTRWSSNAVPDGWIWQDIANYYGAGAQSFNWMENQFDLILRSGNSIGDPVTITGSIPKLYKQTLRSAVVSAAKGTGDNAYIYFDPKPPYAVVRGTIPVNEERFVISGALLDPYAQFAGTLLDSLSRSGKALTDARIGYVAPGKSKADNTFYIHQSPPLDSIIYWFNKKSINLYGEALIKKIGLSSTGMAATDSGVNAIKKFWQSKGIDEEELNISDGSGLSPQNRITTHAQVEILKYARQRPWFKAFFNALPEYNGMHMKSGTISDVKGFCGYHTAANGKEYIFSLLVNNYSGTSSALVGKMYLLLNQLK